MQFEVCLSALCRLSCAVYHCTQLIPRLLSAASIPGGEWGDCPPNKIYLGESIFSPPQSFSLRISLFGSFKNATFNSTQNATIYSFQ